MRLIRTALIRSKSIAEERRGVGAEWGPVVLRTLGMEETDDIIRLITAASIELEYLPSVTSENKVVVPEEPRKRCEWVIERTSDSIALTEGAACSVWGTYPPAALKPETGEETDWLNERDEFHPPGGGMSRESFSLQFDALSDPEFLGDRLGGVALWAESLSHSSASGRFHEYMRIFERAFHRASSSLIDPLTKFLSGRDSYGYERDEVSGWIHDIRHPLTHADERDEFLVEADVRPVIPRVRQAAFDVLLNKEEWRSGDTSRRKVWEPEGIVGPGKPDAIFRAGTTPTISFKLLEPFEAYPLDPEAGKISDPPDEWWTEGWTRKREEETDGR